MKDERSRKLYDGITNVDDELVEEAQTAPRRSRTWLKWAALAACLVIVAVGAIKLWPPRAPTQQQEPQGTQQKPGTQQEPGTQEEHEPSPPPDTIEPYEPICYQLAGPAYPGVVPYPGENADSTAYELWENYIRSLRERPTGYKNGLDGYLAESTVQFLSGAGTENRVYSPLNVFMALAMLAETTGGESRQQVLDLLGSDSIDALRDQARAVWNASYRADGIVTTRLANSLWLRDDSAYNQACADTLAETYYASVFRGEMGSDDYNRALRSWLSQQTAGLLDGYIGGVKLSPQTALALASTIYYKAGWDDEFYEGGTSPDIFHAPGGDVTCDFMHQTREGTVYRGNGFTAVSKRMRESGWMWLILPDEGTDVDAVLSAGGVMPFLLDGNSRGELGYYTVHLSLPKFDVSSDVDLADGLRALGVTDVFDDSRADFSPLTDADLVYVDKVEHAARVTIDEEGVEAAAYTVIVAPGSAEPGELPEDYYFTLDRPFLFAITGTDGLPLFVGVVNQP